MSFDACQRFPPQLASVPCSGRFSPITAAVELLLALVGFLGGRSRACSRTPGSQDGACNKCRMQDAETHIPHSSKWMPCSAMQVDACCIPIRTLYGSQCYPYCFLTAFFQLLPSPDRVQRFKQGQSSMRAPAASIARDIMPFSFTVTFSPRVCFCLLHPS